jgi:hypothetical protein
MKKLVFAIVFMAIIFPVFAQTNNQAVDPEHDHRNIYYITVQVEKIWLAEKGYLVQYRTSLNTIKTVGVPYDWFYFPASSAELIQLPPGRAWPYMCVFYKDKEFSHVRMYVHRNKSHITWSITPFGADVSRFFAEEPAAFKLEY